MLGKGLLWDRVMNETEIFAQALKLSEEQARQEFLDHACGEDGELRARIANLLQAHAAPHSALNPPRTDAQDDYQTKNWERQDVEIGTVGPYKILQKIGEGGMGAVYMAEQVEPVRRLVALKIVKPGMDSKNVLARFEAERQALAMMEHPHIAKVLDAGAAENGRPYFVMELVNGLPITEYCDQNQLSPKERLELFIDVCKGVQHAHQKGIIHRDLKPSNILVAEYDEVAVPKIIDFGVAKAVSQPLTEKTLFTEFGQVIGTVEYMSPEQAKRNQLDIDTRSDVYSLGIVLYALLTGETPFSRNRLADAAWDEMLRIIREEEPLRPSAKLTSSEHLAEIASKRQSDPARLASVVKGDLDWIVMKSLEKERAKRYATANELAADVARHLGAQPVQARPPSMLDRSKKFIRRNRSSILPVAIVGCLLLGAAIFFWQQKQAAESRLAKRRETQTQKVNELLASASLALGKAISTPIGQSAEWIAVDTFEAQLQDLMKGELAPQVAERADKFIASLEEAKQDRELGEVLEEVLLGGATSMDLKSWQAMEQKLRGMFRRADMDLDKLQPSEVAKRIREHRFSARWVDCLELWIGTRGQMQAFPDGPKLTAADMQPWAEAMYEADTDPLRTTVRKQIYSRALSADSLNEVVESTDLDQQPVRALAWLAVCYISCKAPEKADEIFEFALKKYPQDVMLNYDYALALKEQDRNEEAVWMYNRCVALRPDTPGLWESLAELYEELEMTAAAETATSRAVELRATQVGTEAGRNPSSQS